MIQANSHLVSQHLSKHNLHFPGRKLQHMTTVQGLRESQWWNLKQIQISLLILCLSPQNHSAFFPPMYLKNYFISWHLSKQLSGCTEHISQGYLKGTWLLPFLNASSKNDCHNEHTVFAVGNVASLAHSYTVMGLLTRAKLNTYVSLQDKSSWLAEWNPVLGVSHNAC